MAKTTLACPHCQYAQRLVGSDAGFLVCSHCHRASTVQHNKLVRHAAGTFPIPQGTSLAVNDAIAVQGRRYTVAGITQYHDREGNLSTDYDLIGRGEEIVGLEEADGEWTLNRYLPNGERLVTISGESAGLFKQDFQFDDTYALEVHAAIGEFEEPFSPRENVQFDYYEGEEYGLVAEKSPPGKVLAWYLSYSLRPDEITLPSGRKPAPGSGGLGERVAGFLGGGTAASRASSSSKPASSSEIIRWSFLFAAAAIVIHLLFMATSQNKLVYESGPRNTGETRQANWISEPFELMGRRSNVRVTANTNLNNQWMGFELALVNKATNQVFQVYEDAGYWYGYDGGERWTEGTPNPDFYFSSIPAGIYVLEVITHTERPNIQYRLTLHRDVARGSYLLYVLIAFMVIPGIFLLRRFSKS